MCEFGGYSDWCIISSMTMTPERKRSLEILNKLQLLIKCLEVELETLCSIEDPPSSRYMDKWSQFDKLREE